MSCHFRPVQRYWIILRKFLTENVSLYAGIKTIKFWSESFCVEADKRFSLISPRRPFRQNLSISLFEFFNHYFVLLKQDVIKYPKLSPINRKLKSILETLASAVFVIRHFPHIFQYFFRNSNDTISPVMYMLALAIPYLTSIVIFTE